MISAYLTIEKLFEKKIEIITAVKFNVASPQKAMVPA